MPKAHADGPDQSTLPAMSRSGVESSRLGAETTGLVVLWSREEPARMGEIVLLPAGDPGPWTFGRGDTGGDDRRLALVRQRPGTRVQAGPLVCPRISRAQLRLSPAPDGGVLVENLGRCALYHGGREVTRVEVMPGETFALHNELLFLCVRRPPVAPPPVEQPVLPVHPFGEADSLGLVGESPALWDLRHRIASVARQPFHVAILGPSGSGKELVAQAIHARSARGGKPMVSRNAATIPEGLADAELFGNIRNYPNPGIPDRPGLAGQARGSTLFLDEFAELPPSLQAHLLRLMDDGEYQRLGEAITRQADLRILAATNRPESDVRADVLARFKIRITVPGLDARRDDIPLLAVHVIRKRAAADPLILARFFPDGDLRNVPRLSPGLVEALVRHPYTTHMRELEALLLHAAFESPGRYLSRPPERRPDVPLSSSTHPVAAVAAPADEEQLRLARLRHHRFSPTACGRDATYPGNRQSADLHLRQWICKVLQTAGWDRESAVDLLAGQAQGELHDRGAKRIATFLANLRTRMANESEDELRKGLTEEWKGSADLVLRVVDALREGRLEA
jgi:DNA-binding NtrC family response regulator